MVPVSRRSKRRSKPVQREYDIIAGPSSRSRSVSFELDYFERDTGFYVFRVPFLDKKIDTLEEMFEQEQPTNFPPLPEKFIWDSPEKLQMLHSICQKKPTGKY